MITRYLPFHDETKSAITKKREGNRSAKDEPFIPFQNKEERKGVEEEIPQQEI